MGSNDSGNVSSNVGGSTGSTSLPGPSGMNLSGESIAQAGSRESRSDMSHDGSSETDQMGPWEGTSDNESVPIDTGSEYFPTPVKQLSVRPVDLGNKLFVCQTSQFQSFIDQMNATSVCATPHCDGKLVPVSVRFFGLGGALVIQFACTGCSERMLTFRTSVDIALSKHSVVSLALQVAFVAAGCAHAQYSKVLKQNLGMSAVDIATFYNTIKLLHPIVHSMLSEMCKEAKDEMKALDPIVVGSWQRAITTSDGVWLTRKFSQNASFTVRNYMNNSLLYFVHLCMRGKNDVLGGELFKGTSKSAEGHAASIAFGKAKEEGMHIEVQWQDGDSSSASSFREHYPDESRSKVMLCGGHSSRAHTKQLEELAKQKAFTATIQDEYRENFPEVDSVKCHCPRRHHKNCGCMSKAFIKGARTNYFYCLEQAGTDPQKLASRLRNLGRYHARDVHSWEGGKCGFHQPRSCTCGNCDEDGEVLCEGREYHTKNALTCPFHALAYEIECHKRASQAASIIHESLGRGHSNYPEASHNVLVRFRSKDKYLQNIHYVCSTNMGLLQANMTWLGNKHGLSYHWLLDLYKRLKLPILDGMAEALLQANQTRAKNLENKKSREARERRSHWKKKRAEEGELRKRWSRSQRIQHTYGSDEEEEGPVGGHPKARSASVATKPGRPKKAAVTTASTSGTCVSRNKCKCGATDHKNTSHRNCPLNKHRQEARTGPETVKKGRLVPPSAPSSSSDSSSIDSTSDSDDECFGSSEEELVCICGSNRTSHQRSCPLNPRHRHI